MVVRLREPDAAFIAFFMRCGTQGAILPEHLLRGKPDLNRDPFNRQPVGSGPFVVTSYQPGVVVELARNPHFWGKRPALDRISYRIIPNENSLLVALRTHEIDFYYNAPEQQYRELQGLARRARQRAAVRRLRAGRVQHPPGALRRRAGAARRRPDHRLGDLAAQRLPSGRPARRDRRVPALVGLRSHGEAVSARPRRGARAARGGRLARRPRRHPHPRRQAAEHHHAHGGQGDPARKGRGADPARAARGRLRRADPQRAGQPAVRAARSRRAAGQGRLRPGIYGWTQAPDPADDLQTIGPDRVPPYGANYSGLRDPRSARCSATARAATSAPGASPPTSRCSAASTSWSRSRPSSGGPTSMRSATTSAASAPASR